MVPRTYNITFPFHKKQLLYNGKRFFRLLKCSSHYSYLGNQKWFFYGIVETIFFRVYSKMAQFLLNLSILSCSFEFELFCLYFLSPLFLLRNQLFL